MKRFFFAFLTLAFLAPTAAYSNTTQVFVKFDIRNKSDRCVFWIFPNQKDGSTQGYLKPGESAVNQSFRVGNAFGVHYSARIEATIQDCATRRQIVMRYDNVPADATSELSIHKQGSTYIMRHGP